MKSERILAFSAVFISVLALVVSIWQGMVSREHNRLSFTPYLQVSSRLTGNTDTGLYLENAGTGPAFIQSAIVSARGKSFDLADNQWSELFEHIGVEPLCFRNTWLRPGAALRAEKEVDLIKITTANLPLPKCAIESLKFLTEKDAKLIIRYRSIYKEGYELSEEFALKESDLGRLKGLISSLKR